MTDALLAILDDDSPSVRVHAAEALADVGFERYAEVARGVERALQAGTQVNALSELPWVLIELGEPSARKLIASFLAHPEPDVIGSAIEALAELGDPASVKDLEPFMKDEREVEVDTEEGDERVTLAELASEAIDALTPDEE
jgi:HEAT repeat protein